mmetsp:Transcript_15460/g.28624  ORF Transcript_15460/g.28624 Transcript_15460/m.28624 type:complete len:240 (+) Transcript_15460:120-839(+)
MQRALKELTCRPCTSRSTTRQSGCPGRAWCKAGLRCAWPCLRGAPAAASRALPHQAASAASWDVAGLCASGATLEQHRLHPFLMPIAFPRQRLSGRPQSHSSCDRSGISCRFFWRKSNTCSSGHKVRKHASSALPCRWSMGLAPSLSGKLRPERSATGARRQTLNSLLQGAEELRLWQQPPAAVAIEGRRELARATAVCAATPARRCSFRSRNARPLVATLHCRARSRPRPVHPETRAA